MGNPINAIMAVVSGRQGRSEDIVALADLAISLGYGGDVAQKVRAMDEGADMSPHAEQLAAPFLRSIIERNLIDVHGWTGEVR